MRSFATAVLVATCGCVSAFTIPNQHYSNTHTGIAAFHNDRVLTNHRTEAMRQIHTNIGRRRRCPTNSDQYNVESALHSLPLRLATTVQSMHGDPTYVLTAVLWLSTFGISLEKRTTLGKALSVSTFVIHKMYP